VDFAFRLLAFVAGVAVAAGTIISAVRTFVLPRSAPDTLTRVIFLVVRLFFEVLIKGRTSYHVRDRILALYAPFALLAMPPVWLANILFGYMLMFWAIGVPSLGMAFRISGSSLLTLGFAPLERWPVIILGYSEAVIGLMLVALLISYLPTIYSAFQKRETVVTLLEVRAGSPPSAIELFKRFQRLKRLDKLGELWLTWEVWFSEIEESHTSLPALAFFRSPQPDHSWITAAGAVLDAAALAASTLDIPRDIQTDLCIRAGYLALHRIVDFFDLPHNPSPHPGDTISVTREEFDAACRELADSQVPLKPDLDQAWHDFVGWRVNYDSVLLALCALTTAPTALWSADRAPNLGRVSWRLRRHSHS
jgi:hypothetical protein